MKSTEIMKELGLRWRLLGDDEKFLYEEKSRVEKCSYIVQVPSRIYFCQNLFNPANQG